MTIGHPYLLQARRDLEKAENARSKAEANMKAADREISRLECFIEQYESYLNESEAVSVDFRKKIRTRNLTDIAVSVIESSEEPLPIQIILEKLRLQDIEVGGENKAANLAAYLSKDNRVRFERGLGWMPSSDEGSNIGASRSEIAAGAGDNTRRVDEQKDANLVPRRSANSYGSGLRKPIPRPIAAEIDDDIPF